MQANPNRELGGHANRTRMVHVAYEDAPLVGLCGAQLRGVFYPDGTPYDCVVCAELDGQGDAA